MVTCDPATLTKAATCFLCIPKGEKKACNLFALATTVLPGQSASQIAVGAVQFRPFLGEDYLSLKAYFLAKIAGLGNAISALMATARCWQCVPRSEREDVETYLYAQMTSFLTAAAIEKAAVGFRASVESYQQMELYLLFLKSGDGAVSVSTKAAACFRCLSPARLVELNLYLLCQAVNSGAMSVVVPPTPTGFAFLPTDLSGNTVVASWNTPPAGVTATEIWTSIDNVNFSIAATVAAPATSGGVTYSPGQGARNWCQIRWVSGTTKGPFTSSILIPGEVPTWIKAVVTNGGAQVSQGTALAMNTFALTLVNASLDSQMQAVCCFVPDNLIAAITPIYKMAGNDPWTNSNFVAGDLTVNGLTGNATTKILDTGLISTNAWKNVGNNVSALTSGGLSLYMFTTGTVNSGADIGAASNAASGEITLYGVFQPTVNNNTIFDFTNNGGGRISVLNTGWKGFLSANRTSPTASAVYNASSVQAFQTLGTDVNSQLGNLMPTVSFACFGFKTTAGVLTANSDRTLSFAALHFGLTSAQAQTLFNAVQALRTSLGGGFV